MMRRPLALLAAFLVLPACHRAGGGGAATPTPGSTPSPTPTPGPSVLEHHHGANRRGVYVVPALTKAVAGGMVLDSSFAPVTNGNTYAQALYLADAGGHDLVFVTTEQNEVSAFWASNGSVASQRVLAPPNWKTLDNNDIDLGGTAPVLFDMPGAAHAQLAAALGKDGKLYLADRTNLGGIGGALSITRVSQTPIINASVAYTTSQGTYIAFKGDGLGCPNGPGNLTAVRITAGEPPTAEVAWCADQGGEGSPMVTQTQADGGDTIVWSVGSEGDKRLHGFDGDTGAVVYAGGGAAEQMGAIRRFVTPIFAGGRLIVAGDNKVYAFKAP